MLRGVARLWAHTALVIYWYTGSYAHLLMHENAQHD